MMFRLSSKCRTKMLAVMGAALLLGIIALAFMFRRLLGRPIEALIAGTNRIAAQQLDFRFDQMRSDEIGVLQASVNTMAARITVIIVVIQHLCPLRRRGRARQPPKSS